MTTSPNNNPTGSGAIIAFLAIGGVIGGGLLGQPTIGLLAGLGAGVGIAILLWWRSVAADFARHGFPYSSMAHTREVRELWHRLHRVIAAGRLAS